MVHINNYKLTYSVCNAEQNNKITLKNNNEWFIFMTESRLVSEWEKLFWVSGSNSITGRRVSSLVCNS